MRPIGREKTTYKAVKATGKAPPLRGIIIAAAALLCAGWIFSVVSVDAAAGGGNIAAAENAAAAPEIIAAADDAAPDPGNGDGTENAAEPGNTVDPNVGNGAGNPGTEAPVSDEPADETDPAEAERIRAERQAKEKVWRERKETGDATYIGNANSHIFHYPHCSSVTDMNWENVVFFYGGRQELLDAGYRACQRCDP